MTDFIRRTEDGIVTYIPMTNVASITFRDNAYTVTLIASGGNVAAMRIVDAVDIAHLQNLLGEALAD